MTWRETTIPERPAARAGVATRVGGADLLLVHADGAWFAVEDRCSHAGCAFSTDGDVDGHLVICDCHGSEFDVRTGEVVRPPAHLPIRTFPVRSVDGVLQVDL